MNHDKVLYLLAGGVVFFAGVTVAVHFLLPQSDVLQALMGTQCTGFSSALFLHIKAGGKPDPPAAA